MRSEPAEQATDVSRYALAPASRAYKFYYDDPRVTLAKPRSTLGYMLASASRTEGNMHLLRGLTIRR